MFGDELELLLSRRGFRAFEQIADVTEPIGAVGLRHLAGLFDHSRWMAMRQADQTHHDADAMDATLPQNAFGPASGVDADGAGLVQPPGRAAFDPAALLGNDVPGVGGEASRLMLGMDGDLPER